MRPIARPLVLALLAAASLTASPALAQRGRSVFPDEGVGTRDALVRVQELGEAGNMPEALRVLQKTLEAEGGQLVQSSEDKDVYLPVRGYIHSLLIKNPELLKRYRLEQEPAARALLDAGKLAQLEETRMLTTSGMEAVLRLTQLELESARFESARLMLWQLERHPDRVKGNKSAADAARLAGMLSAYLPREDVKAWAQRWAEEAGVAPASVIPTKAATIPPEAFATGSSSMSPQMLPALQGVPAQPLQSVTLDTERVEREQNGERAPQFQLKYADTPWMMPTLKGGVVYINDGRRIGAWDAATLGELWQVTPSRAAVSSQGRTIYDEFEFGGVQNGATQKDDVAAVTVSQGVVLGVTGIAEGKSRRGDKRLHAIEANTGKLMWSVDPGTLEPRLAGGVAYGPPVVDADTVVLAVRVSGFMRKDTKLFMVGMNLYTGALKWSRLVGAVQNQQIFGRASSRPDGAVVHQGIVYRGDEIGVTMAYEVSSGRPVWLRTTVPNKFIEFAQFRTGEQVAPQEMCLPVIDGDGLFVVEYPKGRVVKLSLSNGALLAQREGSELQDAKYLVKVGEYLSGVNGNRVALVKSAELANGPVHVITAIGRTTVAGRVTSADERLLVPLDSGVSLIDPKNPSVDEHVDFGRSGNLLVAGDGEKTHLLSVDATRVHTYLSWEEAEGILAARVAAQPKEPQPLLTYVELASRTGRSERVPELADKALKLLDAQGATPASMQQRGRLFAMLLELVRNSRMAWAQTTTTAQVGAAQPVKDIALLDQVMERLSRAAESSPQQVATLLEQGWLREKQNNAAGAIEAYEKILTDTGLAAIELDQGARLGDDTSGTSFSNARTEATERLVALVKKVGPGPYAAFDEEAARLLADSNPNDAEKLAELAYAYPVAAVAPEAWNRASAAYAALGKSQQAKLAAGAGLAAAELAGVIGREGQGEMLGRLTSSLLARSLTASDMEPAYRLMVRLAKQTPTLNVEWNGTVATPGQVADALRGTLAKRRGLPVIGANLARTVQVIESWQPMDPVVRHAQGSSGDCVMMVDENAKSVSMWGVAAEDGRMRQMWSRSYQMRPIVIRVTPDNTLLFWPSPTGGAIESVATIDGAMKWRTPEFASLFGDVDAARRDPGETLNTPLDGPVRPNDLVVTADGSTLVLVQRRGRAGAFDLNNGASLWHTTLGLNRVYEIEQAGEHVVVGGTTGGRGQRSVAGVIALNKRTGKEVSKLGPEVLGDHARWIRSVGDDAVVATANGLLRFVPATGKVAWLNNGGPGASSFAGWVVGEGLFVLDGDVNLWWVSLRDGTHAEKPLDSRGRIVFPVSGVVMGNTLAVSSTQGMVVFNDKGELIGADGLDGQGTLQTPVASESMFVAVENNQQDGGVEGQGIVSRVFMFAHPTGKLLNTERVRLFENPHSTMVIDGKVLLSEGPVTLVLDAPVK